VSERVPLHLFEGFGIEIEYMIVDRASLELAPVADDLIVAAAGALSNEIERGPACWSNELVLHVIELKSNGPLPTLAGAGAMFAAQVRDANALLAREGRALLPTGMHPWMDPAREMRLWPHDDDRIYNAFHRVFDCRGHGWSNLQSTHVNLPFSGDEEFARLHAAVRAVLPVLPALAASTPVMDGRVTGVMDNRLAVYRGNCARIPAITGAVVPEAVFSRGEYRDVILEPMWRDIAPHDPEGVLREEWLNARGAIARFDRMAVEIRVLDTQEHPCADVAVAALASAAVRALAEERWCDAASLRAASQVRLTALFDTCVRDADRAPVADRDYLALFGLTPAAVDDAGALWARIASALAADGTLAAEHAEALAPILERGCLARRILTALRGGGRAELARVYAWLADCLAAGEAFG
jgi:gamma-glutamyl:cysteine ligase YbdK (ATP-grasp superfamily)